MAFIQIFWAAYVPLILLIVAPAGSAAVFALHRDWHRWHFARPNRIAARRCFAAAHVY